MHEITEPKPIPIALDFWLAKATEGLCAKARERVRDEMSAHYQDALAAERNNGRTEDEAAEYAIYDLGDPVVAHRKLQSVYPTIRETRIITGWNGKPSFISMILNAAMSALLLFVMISSTQQNLPQYHYLLLGAMGFAIALNLLSLAAKSFQQRLNPLWRAILWIAGDFSYIVFFCFIQPAIDDRPHNFIYITFPLGLCIMIVMTIDYIRIWRKWRRNPELMC